jgi:3-deoxy-D-manno-octulosonic-acid transferase
MIALYTLFMSIILTVVYPVALAGKLLGRTYLWERLHCPSSIPRDDTDRVWIHAASVGEAGIAFSMACEIKKKYPGTHIFISTITSTGLESVHRLNKNHGENMIKSAFLAPFDHPLITGKFVRKIKPDSFILVETELWPWLIQSLYKMNVPITVINGKLSKRAFRRYMIIRGGIGKITGDISLFCVQSRTFAKRLRMLGAPQERIKIIGNVKFDGLPEPSDYDAGQIRSELGIPEKVGVFVAGSTRSGEEEALAGSFAGVLDKFPDTVMVLAPRHLNRISEVEKVVREAGLQYVKRSTGEKMENKGKKVLILDTMGELIRAFVCADAAFVGGSLSDFGGHNPLEPAALGIPVLFGPFMEQTGSKELLSDGAAVLVHDRDEITKTINTILGDSGKRRRMADAGPAVVKRFKGTLARTLQCMEDRKLI